MLAVGDAERPEFRDVLPALRRLGNVETSRTLNPSTAAPDLCFLLQATPGEFSSETLEAMLLRWPLTRFITIAGSLCEGEPRTGRPWQGQTRLYWHEFPAWWSLQLARLQVGAAAAWALPRTSREDDVVRHSARVGWPALQGLVGVVANDFDAGGHLATLRDAGLNGCRLTLKTRREIAGLQLIVWDDDDPTHDWRSRLLAFHQLWPSVPMVVLLNFPRVADRDWLEAEVKAPAMLLAKPFDLDAFVATLVLVASRGVT